MTLTPERLEELERSARSEIDFNQNRAESFPGGVSWTFVRSNEAILELIAEIRRLQGEVERLKKPLEKIVKLSDEEALSAFITAWEFDSFRDDVDGEELLKEIRQVLGEKASP